MRSAERRKFACALALPLLAVVSACSSPHQAHDPEPDMPVYRVDEVCGRLAQGSHFRALVGRYRLEIPCQVWLTAPGFPLRRDRSLQITLNYYWGFALRPDRIDYRHPCLIDDVCDRRVSLVTVSLTPKRSVSPSRDLLDSWQWIELDENSPVEIGVVRLDYGVLVVKIAGSTDYWGNPIYYLCTAASGLSLDELRAGDPPYINTCKTMGWAIRENLAANFIIFYYKEADLVLLSELHRGLSEKINSYIIGEQL